jgi:hypothetical protein
MPQCEIDKGTPRSKRSNCAGLPEEAHFLVSFQERPTHWDWRGGNDFRLAQNTPEKAKAPVLHQVDIPIVWVSCQRMVAQKNKKDHAVHMCCRNSSPHPTYTNIGYLRLHHHTPAHSFREQNHRSLAPHYCLFFGSDAAATPSLAGRRPLHTTFCLDR